MSKELDSICARLVFVSNTIRRRDVHPVRDRVSALRRAPRVDLRFTVLCFLRWMPADRRRIKENFGAEEACDASSLRVPLIPADQNADVGVPRFPDAESAGALMIAVVGDVRVTRSEVELLVEERVVRDVHLAVRAEETAIGVNHGGGGAIDASCLPLEDWYDNYHLELARQLLHALHRRPVDRLRQIEALVLLGFAEVRCVEQLLEADDLRALHSRFADAGLGPVDGFPDVVGDRLLAYSGGE